ncbi:ATP-binding protein [Halomicroarcula sp. S1AR25-4]|uniref:ATP-binding protein n=1 Tax=Haloarcula sp. S1AR25-4 TaxID=2950538 RepID=UPI0028751500|nr:ATP-binding protein [Halomicroarcula sp. S1AR25-4]MDS0278751.1 ATP-binding protein [Halomicroarcula sp. S1AR25-4]
MDVSSLSRRVSPSGLVVAALGFFLTRFTVTLAAYDDPLRFLVGGLVPLALGLGLSVFGVALAVGDFERSFVRTVAVWCVAGVGAMLVLVVLTLVANDTNLAMEPVRSQTYLANFLIGGSAGGALTGVYAAQTARQRRQLERQTGRLEMVTRLLRDEVLNAVTVIRGRAEVLQRTHDVDSAAAIERRTDDVATTVENVKHITRDGDAVGALDAIPVADCVVAAMETVRQRYPDARITADVSTAEDATVWANPLLEDALVHLVENAVVYDDAEAPVVAVRVTTDESAVAIAVADEGPGLPADQQALVDRGEVAVYEERSTGFGLNLVRLLAGSYGGRVDAAVDEAGTTITLTLRRADTDAATGADPRTSYGLSRRGLGLVAGASLLAGAVMGLLMQVLGGAVPIIGALYGTTDATVGWITHEFHSVVFGLTYAGLVQLVPRSVDARVRYYGTAVGWAVALWLVAAGLVMPLWLRLVGIPAPLPNVAATTLASHLLWGLTLAVLYRHGRRWLDE